MNVGISTYTLYRLCYTFAYSRSQTILFALKGNLGMRLPVASNRSTTNRRCWSWKDELIEHILNRYVR